MYIDLEELDQTLRNEADELLWGKGLHSLLEKYGCVHLTGSYVLKLMVWRDLDIYLVTEEIILSDFFHLGSQIAELLTPTKMHFRNERVARTEGLPEGLYWGIYLGNERAGAWKIDIWAVKLEQLTELDDFCKEIERRLTGTLRQKIMGIKAECWRKPGYRRRYSSRDIYEAVIEKGVDDLAGFNEYLKKEKGCGLEDA
jgi:hypothetical protein